MTKVGTGRTRNKRLWLGGGALVALLVVLIGWFVVIEPQLSAAESAKNLTESVRQQNVVLATKNTKLKEQNDNIATLRADLTAALAELPSDGGLPEFTRQISAQATASSVVLSSIVVGAATAVAEPATAASTGGPDSAGTGSGSTANSGTASTAGADSSSGLVQMTITVTGTGLGADNLTFLQAIQQTGPRRALVTTSQLAPADGSNGDITGPCTLTLTLTIFSAPLAPADQVALEKLLSGG
ncbi:MAG: hypothetical protein ABJD68_01765 [Nakamurella sp.]